MRELAKYEETSYFVTMKELAKYEETSRVGVKWTLEEDAKLENEIIEKKSYEDIALEHKRTIVGIKLRVIHKIIYPKYQNNIDIESLANEYNFDKDFLEKNINNIEMNDTKKNNLLEINEKIIELLKKIDTTTSHTENRLTNIETTLTNIDTILANMETLTNIEKILK